MLNNWDMTPSEFNVFKKDSNNNYIYHKWSWGSGYIVNNQEKRNKLLNLESYRGFICSYRPPIILPIIILAFIISVGTSFIFEIEIKQLITFITFILYSISCLIYSYKISLVLKGCKKV